MIWDFVLVGFSSGIIWACLQFLKKKSQLDFRSRWKDFDLFKVMVTSFRNGIGAGLGVFLLQSVFGVAPTISLAVLCGLVGEQMLSMAQSLAERTLLK